MSKGIRSGLGRVKSLLRPLYTRAKRLLRRNKALHRAVKLAWLSLRYGPREARERIDQLVPPELRPRLSWPGAAELAAERATAFPRNILISVLVPLYNTPESFLREMIESVRGQTYPNWELCLADGSDAAHGEVGEICRACAEADSRIRYQKLAENRGISGNTNACIDMARGEYIALFDHDDLLHPSALFEVMRAICEKDADYVYTDEVTFESPHRDRLITAHYKPDFAPDDLLANNYICHLSVFSAKLLERVGRFRSAYDGSQDHDMILRLTDAAERVVHVPKVLYWWRSHPQSVARDIHAKQYAVDAARRAVADFIRQKHGVEVDVRSTKAFPTIFQIAWPLERRAKVSIVIPNKDHVRLLRRCVRSILKRTTYDNYEVIVVENNSERAGTFRFYDRLKADPRVRVLRYEGSFNYSRINNWAVRRSDGEYVVLLNNDTKVLTPDWLENLLMYAQRADVGAAGAKLYFPDGRVQHAGIVLRLGAARVAGHGHYGADGDSPGYMGLLMYAQDVSAVTGACLMVARSKFDAVGGLDEDLAVAFNDVDFCLKLREKGYLNVFTPFAELKHYESASRGMDTGKNRRRFDEECERFKARWGAVLDAGDPYFNPNFSLDSSMYEPIRRQDRGQA